MTYILQIPLPPFTKGESCECGVITLMISNLFISKFEKIQFR
jgi:hypothetical protein